MKKILPLLMAGIAIFLSSGVAVNAQTYRDQDGDGFIEISYIEDLDNIRLNLAGTCNPSACNGYELTRSLDFSSASSYKSGSVNTSYTKESGWAPIESTEYVFNTIFEGNGYAIDHLYINRPSTDDAVGLFAYGGKNSIIRNIGVTNVSVSAVGAVGGLVGLNQGGTITQSYVTGSVSGKAAVGGLVGYNYLGTITKSYATGNVTGSSDYVGGLVGLNIATIIQTYATGSVSGSQVGGLVGWNKDNGTIAQSYATGNVTGSSDYVGGLVGVNTGSITSSFWNTDASQTVNGINRTDAKRGIGDGTGTLVGLTLSNMTVACPSYSTGICQLGSDFIFSNGNLPTLKSLQPKLTFVEASHISISIFPNPANDYITISSDKTQKVSSVKVYDMTGKNYELKMSNDELGMKADVKNLPKGQYILVIYGENGEVLKTEKVIKE